MTQWLKLDTLMQKKWGMIVFILSIPHHYFIP
jgi:hypothetical protein